MSCPQPRQEVIHLPHHAEPAGRAGSTPRDQEPWPITDTSPLPVQVRDQPQPFWTRLPSKPGCVQEVVREAQLPPREQRPQLLSENRLAVGSGQWEHGVSPTLWTPTCPCQVVYSGNGCGNFLCYPLTNLSNNPTEKVERAPEHLHLPEADHSRGQCIQEATM